MIRYMQISGSDFPVMQHMFTANVHLSASINISGSASKSIIDTHISYETTGSIASIVKYMSLSCSYMDDIGNV